MNKHRSQQVAEGSPVLMRDGTMGVKVDQLQREHDGTREPFMEEIVLVRDIDGRTEVALVGKYMKADSLYRYYRAQYID